jgi:hypothetical protein
VDWIHLAQDRDKWRLVNTVMNLKSSIKGGEFLAWVGNYQLFKKSSALWS